MSDPSRPRWSGGRLLAAGLALLVLGTGPLLVVLLLSSLSGRPDPNPVELGLLAFFSFWPAAAMVAIGLVRLIGGRVRDRTEP